MASRGITYGDGKELDNSEKVSSFPTVDTSSLYELPTVLDQYGIVLHRLN